MQDLTFVEYFAGHGAVWRMMRAGSVSCTGVGIKYWEECKPDDGSCEDGHNLFDILSDSGFPCGPQDLDYLYFFPHSNHATWILDSWMQSPWIYNGIVPGRPYPWGSVSIWFWVVPGNPSQVFGLQYVQAGWELMPLPAAALFWTRRETKGKDTYS